MMWLVAGLAFAQDVAVEAPPPAALSGFAATSCLHAAALLAWRWRCTAGSGR